MAHKPQSYYVGATKKGKNFIALYDNVEPSAAEQKMIDRFISMGYEVRFDEKKPSKSKEEMIAELEAADKEAAAEFNAYYNKEKKMNNKDGSEMQAFFAACKVYQEWKKKQTEKEKEAK